MKRLRVGCDLTLLGKEFHLATTLTENWFNLVSVLAFFIDKLRYPVLV